ncbi:hypothetical protein N0002_07080 [Pseudomonas aeruginosa]|nr:MULTISPECIES: hypothetical protein [Pseudomonas]AYW72324.1 hypothetical protein EGV95_13285 [Pseudomonas aeruginosa]ERU80271.1 hypothetical protein Q086_02421 [Pseudomonas aeruginosa C23]ERU82175.1 hypothetical protein Q085_02418 [Pseudomonas aeruginosa C20]ERW04765.1 hypothetical protein Q037_02139 [Pseudomonas aeruginosa BWHPSA024]ERW11336.1 hypothetical protein Q036_05898 [Pseudomonas aeruginosa BWHPSA023]
MKKNRALALLSGFAMCIVATDTVFAGTYEWTSAYTQGVEEHLVDDGNGNELNISCPDDERPVTAYASITGKQYSSDKGDGFDVIVDGTTYSNPFFTDCHVCGANFPGFWAALRKANNLQISAEGKTVKLPTKNLKKVLLPYSNKQNICRSAW